MIIWILFIGLILFDFSIIYFCREPKKTIKIEVKKYKKQIPVKQYGISKFVQVKHGSEI